MTLMRTPRTLDVSITNNCNLKCCYCSDSTEDSNWREDLPIEEWSQFFTELNHCATISVTISGGEPLLRGDIIHILQCIVDNRMRYSILTNGTLVTNYIANWIFNSKRCDSVQVSIDGSCPETHDSFRGKGSFEEAVGGLKRLQKHNIPVGVRLTIHRKNVYHLFEIVHYLLVDLKLPTISTNAASYLGRCRNDSVTIQLTTEERSFAMETLLELSEKFGDRISATAGPLAEARLWSEMETARRAKHEGFKNAGFLRSCGGVFSKLAVSANGCYLPCSQMQHLVLGRINKDKLYTLWHNHPKLQELRNRIHLPLSNYKFCNDCDYIAYCRGNCPALAYTQTGSENHPSPDACLKRFLENGGKLPCKLLK